MFNILVSCFSKTLVTFSSELVLLLTKVEMFKTFLDKPQFVMFFFKCNWAIKILGNWAISGPKTMGALYGIDWFTSSFVSWSKSEIRSEIIKKQNELLFYFSRVLIDRQGILILSFSKRFSFSFFSSIGKIRSLKLGFSGKALDRKL